MSYSLSTIRHQGQPTPVIEVGGKYWSLAEVAPELLPPHGCGLIEIFKNWQANETKLLALALQLLEGIHPVRALEVDPQDDDFLTPLQFPSKIIMTGANYWDHVRVDMKMTDFRKEDFDPLFFLKPATALTGSGKSVRYPIQSNALDWEVELAVVIGKGGKRIQLEDAMSHVAGYAIGLDLSARDWQMSDRHPKKFDLFGGKVLDDSSPFGPKIVPSRYINPESLDIKLWVNGELKQNSNTREMIWSIAEQISAISQHLTLEPGDLLFTGSPAGVGFVTGTYLKLGDKIEAEITGLGHLNVEIVEE
ncbi:fumarylacetoacetate hydrolase family protein [Pseudomonas sp. B21-040]|uniref:fumarylacetoacetate hydrolase family protein n=1 Tax=Pseudomonas sp. B21-040 TaxID=2895486 RepID=UPI000FAF9214|nr:fumarylacetoacetate hydrolase family protein [Pseudomonas sp. B21-040]UVL43192.1 fumarylacetoacetate hydrolase family protein [Pseudomonas sp. B21-040]